MNQRYFVSSSVGALTYDLAPKQRVEQTVRESNRALPTRDEKYGAVAPFLLNAKLKDAGRRNYTIQPGGATAFFSDRDSMIEAVTGVPVSEDGETRVVRVDTW